MCRGHKVGMGLACPRTCKKSRWLRLSGGRESDTRCVWRAGWGWTTWALPGHRKELGFYSSVLRSH